MACATIAHSPAETSMCTSLISNRCFDLCRAGRMALAGFPDFKKAVAELKTAAPPPHPDYSVTIAMGDSLVIKEALVEQWVGKPDYVAEMELLKSHNDVYNKRGLKRGSECGPSTSDRPTKKLCIESDAMDLDEFESKFPERRGISLSRI